MDEKPSPDDTLPDDAYFDTIVEMDALVDQTFPQFPMPRPKSDRLKKGEPSEPK